MSTGKARGDENCFMIIFCLWALKMKSVFLAPFSPLSKLFRSVWKVRKMAMTFAPSSLSRGTLSLADVIVTSILPQRWGQGLTPLQVSQLYAGGESTRSQPDCFSSGSLLPYVLWVGRRGVCVWETWVGKLQLISTIHQFTCLPGTGEYLLAQAPHREAPGFV